MHEHQPQPEQSAEQDGDPMEAALRNAIKATPRSADAPRIWASSTVDSDAGQPYGRWISAARPPQAVDADIQTMLSRSPAARRTGTPSTAWRIAAHEGFAGRAVPPEMPLRQLTMLAREIHDMARAFAVWASLHEGDFDHHLRFAQTYQGRYDSLHDYVVLLVEAAGYDRLLDDRVPAALRPYVDIDIDALGHDLRATGDVIAVPDRDNGGVWIFNQSADTRATN